MMSQMLFTAPFSDCTLACFLAEAVLELRGIGQPGGNAAPKSAV
jgi:hypothetical protein